MGSMKDQLKPVLRPLDPWEAWAGPWRRGDGVINPLRQSSQDTPTQVVTGYGCGNGYRFSCGHGYGYAKLGPIGAMIQHWGIPTENQQV